MFSTCVPIVSLMPVKHGHGQWLVRISFTKFCCWKALTITIDVDVDGIYTRPEKACYWPLARTSYAATVPRSACWWAIGLHMFSLPVIQCSARSFLPGQRMMCTSQFNFGSVCQFECSSGFVLDGSNTNECLRQGDTANGVWSAPQPTCEGKWLSMACVLAMLMVT